MNRIVPHRKPTSKQPTRRSSTLSSHRVKKIPRKTPKKIISQPTQRFSSVTPPPTVTFTLVGPDSYNKEITSPIGRGLRQVLQASNVSMLPSICNGQLQCTTCHVKLPPKVFNVIPPAELNELDMLDISADYDQDCSRLACQLRITKAFDGAVIHIPEYFINHMDDPTQTPIPTANLKDV